MDKKGNVLQALRKDYGLTLVDAAAALGKTATQLERLEYRHPNEVPVSWVVQRFEMCSGTEKTPSNKLFLRFPLRMARDVLGLSVEEISSRYGASPSQWRKFECGARCLDKNIQQRVENDVIKVFKSICL